MALVESEIPVRCRWCDRQNHVFLEISPPRGRQVEGEAFVSLVICPECDAHVLPLVRRGVICFGRLEERGEDLVWVAGRRKETA
ncbi:MAG TPA: hypothetical protein VHI31_07780 [Actinomycetota bacterium]|nr:hypothetical protein [Actinomycetota bacterium]